MIWPGGSASPRLSAAIDLATGRRRDRGIHDERRAPARGRPMHIGLTDIRRSRPPKGATSMTLASQSARGVHEMQRDQPVGSGLFGPAADAAEMSDIAQHHHGGSQLARPGNALRYDDRCRHLAETGLSVEGQGRLIVRNQRRTPAAQDGSRHQGRQDRSARAARRASRARPGWPRRGRRQPPPPPADRCQPPGTRPRR